MQHRLNTSKRLFLSLFAIALFGASCIKEDMGDCKYYTLKLVVQNLKGDDITENTPVADATIFIFDQEGKFLEEVKMDEKSIKSRKTIELNYPAASKLQIVAWGGIAGEKQNVPVIENISDLEITLKKESIGFEDEIAQSPDNLYHGTQTIATRASEGTTVENTVVIRQKVGSYIVTGSGFNTAATKASGDNYEFYVRRTPSGINAQGISIGDSVSYKPEPNIIAGAFTTQEANLLPSDKISLDVYKNGEFYRNVDKGDGGAFRVGPGDQANIVVILGQDGEITAKFSIRPWGEANQDEEL